MKKTGNRLIQSEKGQALMLTLILLGVGGLILTPLLNFMGTGLMAGQVFEEEMHVFFAADAGIEDALWQVKNDRLATVLTNPPNLLAYDPFDYNTVWTYQLSQHVNNEEVNVTIQNLWIPKDILTPCPSRARQIIEAGRMIVTGSVPGASTYQINMTFSFNPAAPAEELEAKELRVDTLGIWLPPGFYYVAGSSTLEIIPPHPYELPPYHDDLPEITPHLGGQSVVWHFIPAVPFADFPGVNQDINHLVSPMTSAVTFEFTGPSGQSPAALAWITTSQYGFEDGDQFFWDADTRVYELTSTAGDTTIDAWAIKSELRQLGAAFAGNYFAIGNSLLGGNRNYPLNFQYQLRNYTYADIPTHCYNPGLGIPADATVEAAYLYWSGWISYCGHNPSAATIFSDDASDFPPYWTAGGRWNDNWGRFEGEGDGSDTDRRLTMTSSLDLSAYASEMVVVSWEHRETGSIEPDEGLRFNFSRDGGSTWSSDIVAFSNDIGDSFQDFSSTIPAQYLTANFKLRFFWEASWGGEDVYIDNIRIGQQAGSLRFPADPTPENLARLIEDTARVNKVLFNDTPVIADTYQVLYPTQFPGTIWEDTWFYTAMADVTALVEQWIEDDLLPDNGAGLYTLGHFFVGTDPNADNYRGNAGDPDYSFDFFVGGGSTGYPLGTPAPPADWSPPNRYQAAHSGWSLIIIYSSPETKGHQLFLFDITNPNFDFLFGWQGSVDFDGDGNPGGSISGFLVPDQIDGETLAGRITLFVGEGDAGFTDDRFYAGGQAMSNSASPVNNVWNSNSPGLTVPGVDIDTFDITWGSGILSTGDTSVEIKVPTEGDGFTITYIILSFRSEITMGGTVVFLIR